MKKFLSRVGYMLKADMLRKISALVLACLLYWTLSNVLREERTVTNVPVEIQTDDNLFGAPSYVNVNVTVAGPKHLLKNDFAGDDFAGRIVIREKDRILEKDGDKSDRYKVALSPRFFKEHNGVKVIRVHKDSLVFNLQRQIDKNVKVRVQTNGEIAVDYDKSLVCIPDTIRITGPENLLQNLKEVMTEDIPFSGNNTSFERRDVKIINPFSETTVSPESVNVSCTISPRAPVTHEFPAVPVLLPANSNWELKPLVSSPHVKVIVDGPPSQMEKLRKHPESIKVFIDLADVVEEGKDVPLRLHGQGIPGDVNVRFEPETIRFEVKKKSKIFK